MTPTAPRVPPDFARTARRLLTVTETLCPACAPQLDYWNHKAKAAGELQQQQHHRQYNNNCKINQNNNNKTTNNDNNNDNNNNNI